MKSKRYALSISLPRLGPLLLSSYCYRQNWLACIYIDNINIQTHKNYFMPSKHFMMDLDVCIEQINTLRVSSAIAFVCFLL